MLVSFLGLGAMALRLAARNRRQQRDIDQLTEALKRSREHAEEQIAKLTLRSDLEAVKDEFISTVSHELRQPLTAVRGALGLLSAGLLGTVDTKAKNLLRIATTNTERLIRLINDILDLERMESGRAPLKLRRCSIYELADEAVDTMGTMAEGAGIQLDLNCHAARDAVYFDADADRMLQVLTNLLSNAIKFSPAGSTVAVEIDSDSSSLLLKVVDHGRGIPVDKLEAVFDRFQQVESSDASKKGGTGLGLAICRSIIQQHGGAIWALPNQTGPGTTLWVQLSRTARASESAATEPVGLPMLRGEEAALLGDEGSSVGVEVEEQLREYGYEVRRASNGAENVALPEPHSNGRAQGGSISPPAA